MTFSAIKVRFLPALVLTLAMFALPGCGGGGQESPEPVDRLTALEVAHGGAKGLRTFFDSHTESEIASELATYGIGYEVHDVPQEQAQPFGLEERAQPQLISDCVKFFPSTDRVKWHNFNGEYYYIDSSGRPNRTYSDLPPIQAQARIDSCQTSIGQWGDAENPSNDYDGGHLIGSQLGGWGGRANIVPQDANFNRGNWAQLENKMASCGNLPSGAMRYSINVGYPNSSALVPSSFVMEITRQSTGAKVTLTFSNVDYGGSNGTNERIRGVNFLTSQGC